jgi:hypothetical protein
MLIKGLCQIYKLHVMLIENHNICLNCWLHIQSGRQSQKCDTIKLDLVMQTLLCIEHVHETTVWFCFGFFAQKRRSVNLPQFYRRRIYTAKLVQSKDFELGKVHILK